VNSLSRYNDRAMPVAQLDLPHVPSGDINLFGNDSRAREAAAGLASRGVPTPMDANGYRRRIEVGLEHGAK
jgi:hypothetical protein